jgi:hypothetical protein
MTTIKYSNSTMKMMSLFDNHIKNELTHCKCGRCDHDHRHNCMAERCYCCDLEDTFSLLTQHEFDPPQSKLSEREKPEHLGALA